MPMARCLLRAAALAALVGGVYAPTGQTFASTQAQLDCLQLGRGREFTCDDLATCTSGTCEDCPTFTTTRSEGARDVWDALG